MTFFNVMVQIYLQGHVNQLFQIRYLAIWSLFLVKVCHNNFFRKRIYTVVSNNKSFGVETHGYIILNPTLI